jgi:diaminopropionate ammonia-lyase
MTNMTTPVADSPRDLFALWPDYRPTPLIALPQLAERCGIGAVWVKDESRRPLGSFKVLGGMYAGLRALARAAGAATLADLVSRKAAAASLPRLICASDGNHGLAVAAAAELAGGAARVYLHGHVPESRARRIAARGAEIVWIAGSYDDAVDAALAAAGRGEGLLISDTSSDAADPVTADVMAGYGLMADEIVEQLRAAGDAGPTHLFVQAGVGGLAAALARGLCETHRLECCVIVVEPERVDCVGQALRQGRIERLAGDLHTAAEMLSCGEASAPAVEILRRVGAVGMSVSEAALSEAVAVLRECGGPATTESGATGAAGLLIAAADWERRAEIGLDRGSRVLLIATEGPVPEA